VRSLRSNQRIDGLYVFVAPPSLEELERRLRGRLREAESTIAKRLAWAAEEVDKAVRGAAVPAAVAGAPPTTGAGWEV
jgi:guanylate kinase